MKKLVCLFGLCSFTFSNATVLDENQVNVNKPALKIASYKEEKSLIRVKKLLEDDNLFIRKYGEYYAVYIINFKDKKSLLTRKKELKIQFPDSIVKNKLSDDVLIEKPLNNKKQEKIVQLESNINMPKKQNTIKSVFNQKNKKIKNSNISEENQKNIKFTEEDIIKYKVAVNAFNTKDYEKSYDMFNELFFKYLDHVKVNFYLGRSSFELKKYNEAYAAYQRILIKDEDNQRVRLEMGRILYVLKSYDDALKEFERVLKYPIPAQVRKNVQALMSAINDAKKTYYFSGAVQAGLGWDENINNNSYLDLTQYGTVQLENDTNEISDTFNKFILVLNLVKPFEDKRFAYEGNAILYTQNYLDSYFKNLALISLTNGSSYIQKDYKLSLNLLSDKIWYEADPLLVNIGISPKLTYLYSKTLILNTSFKYVSKMMSKPSDEDKDATIKNLAFDITKVFEDTSNMQFKTYYTTERKKRGTRLDVDKDTHGINITYGRDIYGVNTVFSYAYDETVYQDDDPILPKREDQTDMYSVTFTKTIDKTSSISANYLFIDVESNIESFTYDKNMVAITYTKTF